MPTPFAMLRAWTDPTAILYPGFAYTSYALFRLSGPLAGCIVATRSPDGTLWQPGAYLPDLADLSPMAQAFLQTGILPGESNSIEGPTPTEPGALFVWTRTGLGHLSRRYALSADLGLLLHVHVSPAVGARLLCSGVFWENHFVSDATPERRSARSTSSPKPVLSPRVSAAAARLTGRDMSTWEIMTEAYRTLRAMAAAFEAPSPSPTVGLPTVISISSILALADYAGCRLTVELDGKPIPSAVVADLDCVIMPKPERHALLCHSPQVLELLLLCLFSEVRMYSRDRSALCRITSGVSDAAPALSLSYTPSTDVFMAPAVADRLDEIRAHLICVATENGMELTATPLPLHPSDAPPLQTITLDWLCDPSLLPTGDLKTGFRLRDDSHALES